LFANTSAAFYSWSGPNGFNSNQQNPVLTNAQSYNSGNYYLSVSQNGCPSAQGFTNFITVNQTPTVAVPLNQNFCIGQITTPLNFSGTPGGVIFNWTNNNPSIGLAANGTGNIPAFTAISGGTALITVTPNVNGCLGASQTFTITVGQAPTINTIPNQLVCDGSTTVISFTGSAGAVFNWTNNNAAIGLPSNGTGNISFTALNKSANLIIATITVTPTFGAGCTGMPITFTITVNSSSLSILASPSTQTVWTGSATSSITFTGGLAGAIFTWTNNDTSIGLASSGTGNIPSFTAVNTGTTLVTATITVTANPESCPGAISTATITVEPVQTLNLYFQDADGDGYGSAQICKIDCSQPPGYVTNNTDCDDTNAAIHPGAQEICGNGKDDNCNGQIDEAGCANACTTGLLTVTVNAPSGAYTLYVTPADNNQSITWGGDGTNITVLPDITTQAGANADFNGASNTAAIVAQLGNNGGVPYPAKLCTDLVVNGCGGWYLPSAGELNAIYQQLGPTPNNNFASDYYWTSTENGGYLAWIQDFNNGSQFSIFKAAHERCRCVRK
jgi:hypothetical protein